VYKIRKKLIKSEDKANFEWLSMKKDVLVCVICYNTML